MPSTCHTPQRPPLGLQKIVLGNENSIEDPKILDAVQAAGYEALECGAENPKRFKEMLDERGMHHAGLHVVPAKLHDPTPLINACHTLGSTDISNSGLLDWHARTLADFKATAKALNKAGRILRAEGIHLHYHNHDFEFEKIADAPDRLGVEVLLEEFDPDAVDLCIDVGWVHRAGVDPADFLRKHRDQIGYIHLKDYNDQGWIEHGRGIVPFDAIIREIERMPDVRWVILEQDTTKNNPFESIRISRSFFKNQYRW